MIRGQPGHTRAATRLPATALFRSLEEQGSFTSAARRRAISKAAMSQRMVGLERAAGVPLIQRTTRSVRLTEAGQRLVDETHEAYARIAHSFADVQDQIGRAHV